MVQQSQKSLFAKVIVFFDDFAPCLVIAKSLLQKMSCAVQLPLTQVEATLRSVQPDGDVDLVIFVSRVINPGKITDPVATIATNAKQFIAAIGQGKRIIYLSGHYMYLMLDREKEITKIAEEVEAFSHAFA